MALAPLVVLLDNGIWNTPACKTSDRIICVDGLPHLQDCKSRCGSRLYLQEEHHKTSATCHPPRTCMSSRKSPSSCSRSSSGMTTYEGPAPASSSDPAASPGLLSPSPFLCPAPLPASPSLPVCAGAGCSPAARLGSAETTAEGVVLAALWRCSSSRIAAAAAEARARDAATGAPGGNLTAGWVALNVSGLAAPAAPPGCTISERLSSAISSSASLLSASDKSQIHSLQGKGKV